MLTFIKKNGLALITFALTAIILVSALSAKDGLKHFYSALIQADVKWFFLSFALILAYWLCDTFTLHILTLVRVKSYKLYNSFVVAILGLLYSALTPFATGGQPVQIYEMNKAGVKTGVASAVITVKSLIYQAGIVAYALLFSAFTWRLFESHINHFWLYMSFGIICNALFIAIVLLICLNKKLTMRGAAVIVYVLHRLKIVKDFKKTLSRTFGQIKLFRKSMRTALNNKRISFVCLLITALQLTALYAVPYTIYRAFHFSEAVLFNMIAANSIITMITAFVPLPGGAGAAEGSFYIFFKMFIPESLLLSVVVMWRMSTYYSCIIFGGLVALFDFSLKSAMGKNRKTV